MNDYEELAHLKELLQQYQKNRRILEQKYAVMGINTPIDIHNQLDHFRKEIENVQQQIQIFEQKMVEGDFNLAEMDYLVLLSEVWNTPLGRPLTNGNIRLEQMRINKRITFERAKELENQVRQNLVIDLFEIMNLNLFLTEKLEDSNIFSSITINQDVEASLYIDKLLIDQTLYQHKSKWFLYKQIGSSIRLDIMKSIELFMLWLPNTLPIFMNNFNQELNEANNISTNKDSSLFIQFLDTVYLEIVNRIQFQ